MKLDAVIQIEIMHAFDERQFHLWTVDVVFVAIDDRPNGLIAERPAARKNPKCSTGANGSQPSLTRNGASARSIVATRRVASASRGAMPFQMPQTFSQLPQPTPLKNANCRSFVLSRFQRSEIFTM